MVSSDIHSKKHLLNKQIRSNGDGQTHSQNGFRELSSESFDGAAQRNGRKRTKSKSVVRRKHRSVVSSREGSADTLVNNEDMVRLYLEQAASFPIMNKAQEQKFSDQLYKSRLMFRRSVVMTSEHVANKVIRLIERVINQDLVFDRNLEANKKAFQAGKAVRANATNMNDDSKVPREDGIKALSANIKTAKALIAKNQELLATILKPNPFAISTSKYKSFEQNRLKNWKEVKTNRAKLGVLLNDGPYIIRENKLKQIYQDFKEEYKRLKELRTSSHNEKLDPQTLRSVRKEYLTLRKKLGNTPGTLKSLMEDKGISKYEGLLKEAKKEFVQSNLKWVVALAKKFQRRGLPMLDLISEGNTGLLKAADKFNPKLGFKFTTYATWWIRQSITRAIADQSRVIRIPIHMIDGLSRITSASVYLFGELGRKPTETEICDRVNKSNKKNLSMGDIRALLKFRTSPISLNYSGGNNGDQETQNWILVDNDSAPEILEDINREALSKKLKKFMKSTLGEREVMIIALRYGLDGYEPLTLQEVGDMLKITRERVRQIEAKAIKKMQNPSRISLLKGYIDTPN